MLTPVLTKESVPNEEPTSQSSSRVASHAEELCEVGSSFGTGSFVSTGVSTGAERLHLFVDGAARSDQGFAMFIEP